MLRYKFGYKLCQLFCEISHLKAISLLWTRANLKSNLQ